MLPSHHAKTGRDGDLVVGEANRHGSYVEFEQHFSAAQMGRAMLQVYQEVLSESYKATAVKQLDPAVDPFNY